MKPMTVLLAIDGSPCSQVAVDLVRTIPWPDESVIHIATVVDPALPAEVLAAERAAPDLIDRSVELIGPVAHDLKEIAGMLVATGARIETHVLTWASGHSDPRRGEGRAG